MILADASNMGLWQNFFVMVGGGSAALTGLVFVAMSLNVKAITHDPTHRYRSIGTLTGFTAVFMICGLALLSGVSRLILGGEWLVISAIADYVYVRGYILAVKRGGSAEGLSLTRVMVGSVCYLGQIIGSSALMLGQAWGFYLAATAMIAYFPLMISGAWLLIVGVHEGESSKSVR